MADQGSEWRFSTWTGERIMKHRTVMAGGLALTFLLAVGCSHTSKTTTPTEPDTTPPARITDLRVVAPTATSLTLEWTASGDDWSEGIGAQYDIRYSDSSTADWADMLQLTGEPVPKPPGNPESFVVFGLEPNTTYYFMIKEADEAQNWSDVSNKASGTTSAAG
jgi:hypothetical protein